MWRRILVFLLVSSSTASSSLAIDFDFHGFSNFKAYPYSFNGSDDEYSAADQALGLQTVFRGKGFYNGIPYTVYDFVRNEKIQTSQSWKAWLYTTTMDYCGKICSCAEKKQIVSPLSDDGQFAIFGRTPSPSDRAYDVNVSDRTVGLTQSSFTRAGKQFINNNCFVCHSGVVATPTGPMVVAGLGNNYIDQHALMVEAGGIADLLQSTAFQTRLRNHLRQIGQTLSDVEEEELTTFVKKVQTAVKPTFRHADTVGFNAGPFGVWALLARLIDPKHFGLQTWDFEPTTDPDNPKGLDLARFRKAFPNLNPDEIWELYQEERAKFEEFKVEALKVELPPVFPNAWYVRKYRKAWGYWYGDQYAGFDRDAGVHFAQNFTDEHPDVNANHQEHSEDIARILNFANSTKSPAFPGKLNGEWVKQGRELFHHGDKKCFRCHGTYEKVDGKPYDQPGNWIVEYTRTEPANVNTDAEYWKVLQRFEQFNREFAKDDKERTEGLLTFFGDKMENPRLAPKFSFPEKDGYFPPPLVGTWASGPYFHNGSVPTLEQVLDSSKRPEVWAKMDLTQYDSVRENWDFNTVGIPHWTPGDNRIASYRSFRAQMDALEASGQPKPPTFIYTREYLEMRNYYDTKEFGKSNAGHNFGDKLTTLERNQIIEFLKSVSGEGIVSKEDYNLYRKGKVKAQTTLRKKSRSSDRKKTTRISSKKERGLARASQK